MTVVSPRFLAKSHAKQGERRRAKRTPFQTQAFIASPTATDPADRLEVTAVDLSRHGVAFRSPKPVAVDSYYKLQMARPSGTSMTEIRIIRCIERDGGFDVGSEFT